MLLLDFAKQNEEHFKVEFNSTIESMAMLLVAMLSQVEVMKKDSDIVNNVIGKYLQLYVVNEGSQKYNGYKYMLDAIESEAYLDVSGNAENSILEMIQSLTNFVMSKRAGEYKYIDLKPVYPLFHQYNS